VGTTNPPHGGKVMALTFEQAVQWLDDNEEELQRAYDIHELLYEGKSVSKKDQKFYDKYVRKLSNKPSGTLPLSVYMWLIYAGKYVSK
jgi:hypothetical protein